MSKNKIKELWDNKKELLKNKKVRIIGASVLAGIIALGAVGYIIGMEDSKVVDNSKDKKEDKVFLAEKENEVTDLKDKLNDENISEEEKKEIETKIAENEVAINEEENSTSNDNENSENKATETNTTNASSNQNNNTSNSNNNNNNSNQSHSHNWSAVTNVVHHDEVGHWEDILISAAWSEQVPVFEDRELSICNTCGEDITGNTSAHLKKHALNGENASYRGEWRTVQVGTNTINHPAKYDKKWVIDKAAWNETVTTGYKCSSCGATK